nr:F-box/LRR-repeat protein At5g63520 isoform X2 [Ipomoea batatas]
MKPFAFFRRRKLMAALDGGGGVEGRGEVEQFLAFVAHMEHVLAKYNKVPTTAEPAKVEIAAEEEEVDGGPGVDDGGGVEGRGEVGFVERMEDIIAEFATIKSEINELRADMIVMEQRERRFRELMREALQDLVAVISRRLDSRIPLITCTSQEIIGRDAQS